MHGYALAGIYAAAIHALFSASAGHRHIPDESARSPSGLRLPAEPHGGWLSAPDPATDCLRTLARGSMIWIEARYTSRLEIRMAATTSATAGQATMTTMDDAGESNSGRG
jgi:hypothetical protein